ncbi:hypothetical protein ACJJTC_013388 [Scirpophaga incertulas]
MDRKYRVAQVMMFAGIVLLKKKKKRSVWVKKYRQQYSHMTLIEELRDNYPDDFKNYLRMDNQLFNMLLNKIKHKISKQDTVMRESIDARARLAATLRYLATGRSFEDLKFSTGISAPSLSKIIPETVTRGEVTTDTMQHGERFESSIPLINLQRRSTVQMSLEAKRNRDQYKTYFNTDGCVEWQDRMVSSGRA